MYSFSEVYLFLASVKFFSLYREKKGEKFAYMNALTTILFRLIFVLKRHLLTCLSLKCLYALQRTCSSFNQKLESHITIVESELKNTAALPAKDAVTLLCRLIGGEVVTAYYSLSLAKQYCTPQTRTLLTYFGPKRICCQWWTALQHFTLLQILRDVDPYCISKRVALWVIASEPSINIANENEMHRSITLALEKFNEYLHNIHFNEGLPQVYIAFATFNPVSEGIDNGRRRLSSRRLFFLNFVLQMLIHSMLPQNLEAYRFCVLTPSMKITERRKILVVAFIWAHLNANRTFDFLFR